MAGVFCIMYSYLIVDGYNLIYRWKVLIKAKRKSLEFARSELLRLIQPYCDYNTIRGIIVYDGSSGKRHSEHTNPKVIFSGKGESADTVIESLAYKLVSDSRVVVATDDRVQANLVSGMGASLMSADMLETEARKSQESLSEVIRKGQHKINRPLDI